MAAEGRSQGAGSGEEDKGELKLTGNLFSVLIGQREHRFAVTLESVLIGMDVLKFYYRTKVPFSGIPSLIGRQGVTCMAE